MKPLTNSQMRHFCESFLKYASAEEALLVVDVLKENRDLLKAVSTACRNQGKPGMADGIDKLVKVDEMTIRAMSDGLHAIMEKAVKEPVKRRSRTKKV